MKSSVDVFGTSLYLALVRRSGGVDARFVATEGLISVGVFEAGDFRTAGRSPLSGSAEC